MLALFIKGFIIGFAIAAPIGPTGILCIQRSLHGGFNIGFMTGIGAALADGVYGLIAGFGLTAISSLLITHRFWIRSIGGLFLLYLGIKLFFTPPPERSIRNAKQSPWHALVTAFLLTVTNPATVLSFVAVFAGLGLGTTNPDDYRQAIALVIGITLGSAVWWLSLSSSVAFILHHRLSPTMMQGINRFSGMIIFAFGIFALLKM